MGEFCALTGYTPTEFWEMTQPEYEAILKGIRRVKQHG